MRVLLVVLIFPICLDFFTINGVSLAAASLATFLRYASAALGFLIITADNKKMKERTQRISTQEFMESLANGLQARWDIEEFS